MTTAGYWPNGYYYWPGATYHYWPDDYLYWPATRLLTAEHAVYAVEGQDANILRRLVLDAKNGHYSLDGHDAGLVLSRLLSAAGGIYTLDGRAVTLLYSEAVMPDCRVFVAVAEDRMYIVKIECA